MLYQNEAIKPTAKAFYTLGNKEQFPSAIERRVHMNNAFSKYHPIRYEGETKMKIKGIPQNGMFYAF